MIWLSPWLSNSFNRSTMRSDPPVRHVASVSAGVRKRASPCWPGSSGPRSRGAWRWANARARVRRLGDARDTAAVTSRGPRQAHLEGFDLHANVWVSANDRAGLERLCRYVLRPPLALRRD